MKFALFFLEEFTAAFTLAAIAATLFFGGWQPLFPGAEAFWLDRLFALAGVPFPEWLRSGLTFLWFFGKSLMLVFVLMWIRSTLPRVRVDQLMGFAWKGLIPAAFVSLTIAGLWVVLA
jgi:NADH-quinone oxidoreductase subunit H